MLQVARFQKVLFQVGGYPIFEDLRVFAFCFFKIMEDSVLFQKSLTTRKI